MAITAAKAIERDFPRWLLVLKTTIAATQNAAKLQKGTVKVTLDEGADLYIIECLNMRGRIVKFQGDVFCDELAQQIDWLIEQD